MTASTRCGSSAGQFSGINELLHHRHLATGVDVGDALAQRQHLGLAQRGAQRLHLAVDVAFGHVVKVDEHQRGHTAARQRLGRPGADAADADHGHARGAQTRIAGVTVQPAQRAEAALQVGLQGGTGGRHSLRSTRQAWYLTPITAPARMPPSARKLPSASV
jgi:hypothetical protein